MAYNKADEAYINTLVTERYWEDIKTCFKEDADDSLKRIHYNGNDYQCRMTDGEFCIGAKDIWNPERLDFLDAKGYLENTRLYINRFSTQLKNMKIDTLDEKLEHIKKELLECYKEINEIEENSYVKLKKNVKEKEIER